MVRINRNARETLEMETIKKPPAQPTPCGNRSARRRLAKTSHGCNCVRPHDATAEYHRRALLGNLIEVE
jgi:hypothetical protein